jgi:ElaB/YqjD/DUF883 family membrane-anchored ribosome-binding protein
MAEDAVISTQAASDTDRPASTPRTTTTKGPAMETDTIENTETPANTTATEPPAPEKPSGPAQMLKDGASQLTKEAGNKARTYVEDGKSRAGGALDELAKLMTDAAGTVDEKVGEQYGQYARNAADAVTGFSESLKAKNVDELIGDATDFVKKSPAIAIGTAAAVGFVLVRLLQSGLNADTTAPKNDTNA